MSPMGPQLERVWAHAVVPVFPAGWAISPIVYVIESSAEDQSWNVYSPDSECLALDLTNRDEAVMVIELDAGKRGWFVDEDEAVNHARIMNDGAQ